MKVGVAGYGTIGRVVARALDKGIEGLELEAVCTRSVDKARALMATDLGRAVPLVSAEALAERCDVIAEAVPRAAFVAIAVPVLAAGKVLLTVSAAGLLDHWDLVDRARRAGGRIHLATGALLGLDAVKAAAEGTIHEVRMITRKPPAGLEGAPYLAEHNISLAGLTAPKKLFEGSARDGARGFPANVNVAAALGLAGIGPDATRLEIWADPTLTRNTHIIAVEADSARFTMTIENVPTEHASTGRITALSVIAALRGIAAPLYVGT